MERDSITGEESEGCGSEEIVQKRAKPADVVLFYSILNLLHFSQFVSHSSQNPLKLVCRAIHREFDCGSDSGRKSIFVVRFIQKCFRSISSVSLSNSPDSTDAEPQELQDDEIDDELAHLAQLSLQEISSETDGAQLDLLPHAESSFADLVRSSCCSFEVES